MNSPQPTTPPLFDPPTPPPQVGGSTPPGDAAEQPLHPCHQVYRDTISQQPQRGETGFVAYARDLASAVCEVVGGTRWEAEATSPAWPSREVDQHTQVSITVDDRHAVVLTTTKPAGRALEQWTITVDGQPIPHRAFPGEVPHHVVPVARSVWRHFNGVSVDSCDRLLCDEPATVATYGSSTCVSHAEVGAAPTRPPPSAAGSPPLPHPARTAGGGSPARAQPKGGRR